MLSSICGDIIGSTFERSIWAGKGMDAECIGYDVIPNRAFRRGAKAGDFELFHPCSVATDDSIETVAVMDWLLKEGDDELAPILRSYFKRYPNAGFGKKFAEWATSDTDGPCESFGNGAAMRASPIAYTCDTIVEVMDLAKCSALATHSAPDAVAGAQAAALAVFLARKKLPKERIAERLTELFGYDLTRSLDEIRPSYTFTSLCPETVPYAIRAFLESETYVETIRRAISIGGDSDTIACMAGGIAGAYWGMPCGLSETGLTFLDHSLRPVVKAFAAKFSPECGLC